nr:hypothetical protein [Tanacetum cinerariifolium]
TRCRRNLPTYIIQQDKEQQYPTGFHLSTSTWENVHVCADTMEQCFGNKPADCLCK